MKRSKQYFIIVILLTLVALTYYYSTALKANLSIRDGELDLSESVFKEKGVVALDGEWEFYWKQFLTSEDFTSSTSHDLQYLVVPGNWSHDQKGNAHESNGFATYRMVVTNIPTDTKYFGLLKGNIRNASRIYVNGELVLHDGEISESLGGNVSGNNSMAAFFEMKSSTAEVIIQASNYDFIVGGIARPITFGTQKEI